MSKLTSYQKTTRKELKDAVFEHGGSLFTYKTTGTTIVVAPRNMLGDTSRFVSVSVAQCSKDDEFSRKYGEFLALTRWEQGSEICVPRMGRSNGEIADLIWDGFFSELQFV